MIPNALRTIANEYVHNNTALPTERPDISMSREHMLGDPFDQVAVCDPNADEDEAPKKRSKNQKHVEEDEKEVDRTVVDVAMANDASTHWNVLFQKQTGDACPTWRMEDSIDPLPVKYDELLTWGEIKGELGKCKSVLDNEVACNAKNYVMLSCALSSQFIREIKACMQQELLVHSSNC